MKLVLTLCAVFAIGLVAASSAQASLTHTCGGSALASQNPDYNAGTWLIVWRQNCGVGKTVEVKVGWSDNNGGTWNTFYDHSYSTSSSEANHWIGKTSLFAGSCRPDRAYRESVYWADGVSRSSGMYAC
jgi:hypothetical protein